MRLAWRCQCVSVEAWRSSGPGRFIGSPTNPWRLFPPVASQRRSNGALNSRTNVRPPPTRIWSLFYSLPTTLLTPPSLSPLAPQDRNTSMPVHRHPSIVRSHAVPYKASIIVISSDEDEDPLPPPKRGSRRPRRSRPEGEVLEILEDTSAKHEEPEMESLRRRCHELEQACSPHYSMNLY